MKINLGIGVYKDAQGTTPIMRAVKEAEKRLFDNERYQKLSDYRWYCRL